MLEQRTFLKQSFNCQLNDYENKIQKKGVILKRTLTLAWVIRFMAV